MSVDQLIQQLACGEASHIIALQHTSCMVAAYGAADNTNNGGCTLPFAAPEVLAREVRGGDKVDAWAMAVTIHFALTCTDAHWHMAFLPDTRLSAAKQETALEAHIQRQQQEWVCSA